MTKAELLKLAGQYFISDAGLSMANLIRKIQIAEGHVVCFSTGRTLRSNDVSVAQGFTPVIMLTTEASEARKKEGQAAGAKAWVIKPFQPAQMLTAVAKLVLP